jgi:hypothetical protein
MENLAGSGIVGDGADKSDGDERVQLITPKKTVHDRALFDALVVKMRITEPGIRVGTMFGCPAVFVGRRMAFCVYGSAIGAKIPQAEAARLIASGMAVAFRPYGRPPMKEWIELQATPADVGKVVPILTLALRYANDAA